MYSTNYKIICFIIAGFLAQAANAQDSKDHVSTGILQGLEKLEHVYPQQKVFIHTDKEEYFAGEDIWLKAYTVNATTHQPDTMSTNLYLELVSSNEEIAKVLLLRLNNGISHGNIQLPDSLSEGNYQIRAYTDWMNNFDPHFIFKKDVYVYNSIEENFIKTIDVFRNRIFNRRLRRSQNQMQFAFFPEGGYIVAGLENTVAFKAANKTGAGVDARGTLYDGDGNEITKFSTFHNGMGSFSFIPKPNTRYSARIKYKNGASESVRLPKVKNTGYLLSAINQNGDIALKVQANFDTGLFPGSEEVYLLAQSRNRVVFFEKAVIQNQSLSLKLPKDLLPPGITQITLFSNDGRPVAERLVFSPGYDTITQLDNIRVEFVNHEQEPHILVDFSLDKETVEGSYSFAVVDTDLDKPDYRSNIAADLLFLSDLDYFIEDPWFYFTPSSSAEKASDLIMLTHGWRRFDWDKLLAGDFPEIRYGFPRGITFAGTVLPRSSERETGELDVEFAIYQDGVDILTARTDRKGNFAFENLEYNGLFSATLRIDKRYDRRSLRVDLRSKTFDDAEYVVNYNTRALQTVAKGENWQKVKRPETVHKSRSLFEPSIDNVSIYSDADQVIYFDDIADQYSNIFDVLRTRVRGLRVVGNEIILRGQSSVMLSNEPLFLVDEILVDRSVFLNVSVHEVERLAVISGPQTAILGSRGANGALLIYTRRSDSHRLDSYEYILQGFHIPDEQFESKINNTMHAQNHVDRTLHWEPRLSPGQYEHTQLRIPADASVRNIRFIIQGIDNQGNITFTDRVFQSIE